MLCDGERLGPSVNGSALDTPLCPAGHLPHRWGDRLVETSRPSQAMRIERLVSVQPISPLEGEIPGRAEGGKRQIETIIIDRVVFKGRETDVHLH